MIGGLIAAVVIFAFLQRTTMVWMTRLDAIALGVLLALFRGSEAYKAFTPTILSDWPFRWAALAILLAGLAVIPTGIVPFFPTMVSMISLLLVFTASYAEGFLIAPGCVRSLLVWIGQRSFAIYLMHNTVFWLIGGVVRRYFPQAHPAERTTIVFIVAAVAILAIATDLSFRFMETPLRRRGKRVAEEFVRRNSAPGLRGQPVLIPAVE
jgi:peptidoglycan/LPS O-acetylase OafA/YrhL